MRLRDFLRAFFRSPAGIALLFLCLASGGLVFWLGAGFGVGVLAAAACLVLALGLGLATGAAQRAASAELDHLRAGRSAERTALAREYRRRLAALRISHPQIASARDLVVLEAGSFIEACLRSQVYDPEGLAALEESIAVVDAWLKEADASSIERRFDLPDADPFPQAAERTAEALRRKAEVISRARSRLSGEAPPSDRLAIEEELK
jgi:hypothetical protein